MILLLKFRTVANYEFNNKISNNNEKITVIKIENYGPPKQTTIPFVTFNNDKFKKSDEAKELLPQKWSDYLGVISLVWIYKTGKSFLLKRFILNLKESIRFNDNQCTKGIWIWPVLK